MKRALKGVILAGVIGMLFSTQVCAGNALTGIENQLDHLERLSGYRCLNSGCQGYLEQRNKLAKCSFCGTQMYAYQCMNCGNWYPICENGHYSTAVGDCTVMHVSADVCKIRDGAGEEFGTIGLLAKQAQVIVVDGATDRNGQTWYRIDKASLPEELNISAEACYIRSDLLAGK